MPGPDESLHHRGFTLPGLDGREVVATAQLGCLAPEERPLSCDEVANGLNGAGVGGKRWLLHAIQHSLEQQQSEGCGVAVCRRGIGEDETHFLGVEAAQWATRVIHAGEAGPAQQNADLGVQGLGQRRHVIGDDECKADNWEDTAGGAERGAQGTPHSPLHCRSQQLLADLEMAEQTERGEIEGVAPLEKKDDVACVEHQQ